MAKRNLLISITEYDRDGGLDWTIHGSDWLTWLRWKRKTMTDDQIYRILVDKFEIAVNRALDTDSSEMELS